MSSLLLNFLESFEDWIPFIYLTTSRILDWSVDLVLINLWGLSQVIVCHLTSPKLHQTSINSMVSFDEFHDWVQKENPEIINAVYLGLGY